MALASQSQSAPELQRGLLRRSSQNSLSPPIIPVVQVVDFCRTKPRLVELEQKLYSLANGSANSREVTESCLSLLYDCDITKEVFNVFCSCNWVDRYKDPIISQLFYELVNIQQDSNADILLLAELEMACEELLKVLTHLGTPNTLQLNVVSLLYNLSRLIDLPPSHLEAVQSYLEEIARALWPYSRPSAPDLWGSEAFCDAQCDVLKACGRFLEEKCPVNTERTFQRINGKLISGDVSQYSRFRLLEIRELHSSGWKLSGSTLNYYKAAYQKFMNKSRKDVAINDSTASACSRNVFKRSNSFGESKSQSNSKPVAVLRICENELRKSCDNLHTVQEALVTRDAVVEEKNVAVERRSCSSVESNKLPAQRRVSLPSDNKDLGDTPTINGPLNYILNRDTNLYKTGLVTAKQPSEKDSIPSSITIGSKLSSSHENIVNSGGQGGIEKAAAMHPLSSVSCDLTEHVVERSLSPCSSDGSDDVFASTGSRDKIVPAMHRGDFKKPRRPFKSDSSLSTTSESPVTRETILSDSIVSNCKVESTLISQLVTSVNLKHELTSETCSVKAAICSGDSDSNSKVVTEEDCGTKSASENWRARKTSSSNETPGGLNEDGSLVHVTENWRERTPVDLMEPQNDNVSNPPNENWRERKCVGSPGFWNSGSQREDWHGKKSMSVDETAKDINTMSSGQSKRYSTGDIHVQLDRQDSNEKGKRSPGGGFGLPKQGKQDIEEASSDEHHEAPKSELVEVQISEEESQGLQWWKLREIQADTGCKIFHNRDKCEIMIRGDPQQCKVAKKRVYSVVAALQEEFGALVPLSDEIIQHLQTEGRCMLAERLVLCSGANVKMINDTQLFMSGHRTCVNLAKAQLAKIKVMLRYTDDPDIGVVSLNQQDNGEEEIQRVDRLFAALEGRPRSLTQTDHISTDLKPSEGSLTRDFLLSCASSPVAQQRPPDLSLDRTEDWVKAIILVNGRRGEQVLLERKKGFRTPNFDSITRQSSV